MCDINDTSLSLKKRTEAAVGIWHSLETVKDKGKRVHLVQWSFDTLVVVYKGKNNSKPEFSETNREEVRGCWLFLINCLEELEEEKEWITFTPHFIEVLCIAMKDGRTDKELMFKCVEMLFSWAPTPAVIMRYDLVLSLVTSFLPNVHYNNIELTITLLKQLSYLQSIHGNPRKVFSSICSNLILFMSLLQREGVATGAMTSSVEEILAHLFISEFLTEYGSLLVLESATDTPDAKRAIFVNQLFNSLIELRSMASSSLFSGTLTILFEILLKQNKLNGTKLKTEKVFLFLLKLLQILGLPVTLATVNEKGEDSDTVDYSLSMTKLRSVTNQFCSIINSDTDPVLISIGKLLTLLRVYGIYQTKDEDQFKHLQILLTIIIDKLSTSNIDGVFMCLEILLKINHLLIEPILPHIWSLSLSLSSQLEEERRFCFDFIDSVVSLYGRLHQLPLLLNYLCTSIEILQEEMLSEARPVLYESTEKILSSLLRALPAAQCLEIFDCFIKKFKEMHLPLIEQLIISRSAKKMRREQESGTILIPIDSRHGYSTISGLLLYVDILSFFISNLSLELFIKGREQEEMKERIKDVTNNIYSSLLQAAIEKTELLLTGVLYLQLVLTKLKYSITTVIRGEGQDGLSCPLFQLDLSGNVLYLNGVRVSLGSISSPVTDYLLRYLCILDLRFAKDTNLLVEETMKYLLSPPQSPTPSSSLSNWNGQVLALDVHNVSRAVYSLILNNLPFLYTLFNTSSTIDQLANIIHKSLIQYTDIDPDTDIDSGFMTVIQNVLVSDSYNQMKSLHISLLNCTMKHLSILWPKRLSKEIKRGLSHDNIINELPSLPVVNADGDKCLDRLQSFTNHLIPSLMILESIPLASSDNNKTFIRSLTVLLHWTMTGLIIFLSYNKIGREASISSLLVLARMTERLYLQRRQQKSSAHGVHDRDWRTGFKWLKYYLIALEEKEKDQEDKFQDLKTAILFAAESLLKLFVLTGEKKKIEENKKKANEVELREYSVYLLSIEDHISFDVSPTPLPCSFSLLSSSLASLCSEESFINFIMTYSSNVIELLDSDSVMEDDLIGNLLSEGEGWKCMAHYNSLWSIYKSVYSSLKNQSCTSINKLLEASFLPPNSYQNQLCFCLLLQMIVKSSASLEQEKRIIIRHWLTKTVTKCIHILTVHSSVSLTKERKTVIILSLHLLNQLVSLPHHVGLDGQTLHLLYHGLVTINECCLNDYSILMNMEQLVFSLVRTHSHTLSPNPLLAIIQFIGVIVSLSHTVRAPGLSTCIELKKCISLLNNLIELLCRHDWFNKYAPHCIAQYIIDMQSAPLLQPIKDLLLCAVLHLIKTLGSRDISFLKSSLNEDTRSSFQDLLEHHNKYNRFKGKI